MTKQFWIILAAIVVLLGGILVISNHKDSKSNSGSSKGQVTKHLQGKGSTGVVLQEWGDYQCPVCSEFYITLKEVQAKYNDQIYFQFSNLPLIQIHQNAFAAARAAEAAGKQGKYFEMHDKLYDGQQDWSRSSTPTTFFNSYAQQIGLDVNKFKTDYASAKVNNDINADVAAFQKTGANEATPTFFLDGKKVDNNKLFEGNTPSVAKFSELIDAAIKAKKSER